MRIVEKDYYSRTNHTGAYIAITKLIMLFLMAYGSKGSLALSAPNLAQINKDLIYRYLLQHLAAVEDCPQNI